ncbi:putative TetR family transcriptional regulator [uncultured Stenotrophomonas sp.]|uniref:Putative TetR family transcriptional regulator n=1 Tax=uncultured Stenotrophomonas sp. TaxID=165438 RepID=A0A1Y5Q161_9GAMM|nr:putative TetR family transcriptional regulator [uncultured Stenotrophomonas sp.]
MQAMESCQKHIQPNVFIEYFSLENIFPPRGCITAEAAFSRCFTNFELDGIVQSMPAETSDSAPAEARDQRVFDTVRELLAVHGMHLSMDAVAAHVGCSKQTLYSRYGSKRELLGQVVRQSVSAAAAPLASGDERPLREVLLDFALRYLEHRNQPRNRQTAQLIATGTAEFREEARLLYQGGAEALRGQLAEWMRTEMARGRIIHDDPHFIAEMLISMIAGQDFERQRFHAPHRDDPKQRRRWAEFAIDAFLRAFPAPPAGIPGTR